MKKIVFTIIIALCNLIGHAENLYYSYQSNSIVDTIVDTAPIREVQATPNGLSVRYIFRNLLIQSDELFEGTHFAKMNGFGLNDTPTEPSIPIKIDQFGIPGNVTSVNIAIRTSTAKAIPFELTPARPPLHDSDSIGYTVNNVPSIAPFQNQYPNTLVKNLGITTYRNKQILNLQISPIRYCYTTQNIQLFDTIIYSVQFIRTSEAPSENQPITVADDYTIENTMEDWAQLISPSQTPSDSIITTDVTKDYLILSVPKYDQAVNKFAQWKKTLGYNVKTVTKDVWSVDTIKFVVTKTYNELNRLYYLLIVGDHEDIPAEYQEYKYIENNEEKDRSFYSDLYYGCMGGSSDYVPDVYRGRLSVSSLEEANIVVDKIINYEKNPPIDETFYIKALHCAYFQDKPKVKQGLATTPADTYEDRRFVLTSEEIRQYLTNNHAKFIDRLYVYNFEHFELYREPQYWNNNLYSIGTPIPDELKCNNYSWKVDCNDIVNCINSGVFYTLFRGHGYTDRWSNPEFSRSDIELLSNENKLPLVFNITCLTGTFANDTCMSETFLRKHNGGAIAVIAASSPSYSGYNDMLILGMINAIWPLPGLKIAYDANDIEHNSYNDITQSKPIYNIGQIMDQGLIKMTQIYGDSEYKKETWELFHCFGDPSMRINTQKPTKFDKATIKRDTNLINVDTGGEIAYISFYNKTDDVVISYLGSYATFEATDKEVSISLSYQNKIPLVFETTQPTNDVIIYTNYIQNEIISDSRQYESNYLKIGYDVSNEVDNGNVQFESGSSTSIRAKSVTIKSSTTIEKGASFKINPTKN